MKTVSYKLPPLLPGILIKRYKRFLADVQLIESGKTVTAHCPNSGSMKGCAKPGSQVFLSESNNPKRKLKYTWELLQGSRTMIGINTQVPNRLVKKAIESGVIDELTGYDKITPEIKTSEHTRLDLLLEDVNGKKCYVEIKNCTLVENNVAMFPDAVTTRGQKHLTELEDLVSQGHRGVIFYLIQRMDAKSFRAADMIDKTYAEKLKRAATNGVEIVIRDTIIDTELISIGKSIPYHIF
ncbi:MAG: DNA/RNA nuclease SfsA [Desulfobacteraceae bacterium]|nr:DNA/RNA nuclease SfsA [Desulfobacteraceae bacterium]